MKRFVKFLPIGFLAFFLMISAFIFYEFVIEPLPSKSDRKFIAAIKQHLQKPGDWAMVSDIHPGDWTHVCLISSTSTGGYIDEEQIRRIFKITTSDIIFRSKINSSTDWNWVVIFFTLPNIVYTYKIPNKILFDYGVTIKKDAQGCKRDREEAVFLMLTGALNKSEIGINLRSVDQIDRPVNGGGE